MPSRKEMQLAWLRGGSVSMSHVRFGVSAASILHFSRPKTTYRKEKKLLRFLQLFLLSTGVIYKSKKSCHQCVICSHLNSSSENESHLKLII